MSETLEIPGAREAIIGHTHDITTGTERIVYDRNKLVEWFMRTEDWDWETADEWVSFNVEGAYVGPGTPLIVITFGDMEEEGLEDYLLMLGEDAEPMLSCPDEVADQGAQVDERKSTQAGTAPLPAGDRPPTEKTDQLGPQNP